MAGILSKIGQAVTGSAAAPDPSPPASQTAILDFLFPGYSLISTAVKTYLHIDLNLYIPIVILCSGVLFAWRYFSEYVMGIVESHLMSVVDIRTDDEIYNMLMTWVATQRFSQGARRFVVNTNVNSRSWYLWRWDYDEDGENDDDNCSPSENKKKKALAYTPTFGSHWFWYRGRILVFRRSKNQQQGFLTVSEREEISISCFGRNPWILKELLHEAREAYVQRDQKKTLIYRGTTKSGSSEPQWQRSMARTSRPFSTVILNEKVKNDLIADVTDYLDPATRRWYSNRGIPYRRGYLLHGPPGTGKSSLSLALAGFFKMRIYIVSLSSVTANEESLSTLFSELPRRCVVLLEDIDTAGLTNTREEIHIQPDANTSDSSTNNNGSSSNSTGNDATKVAQVIPPGRLSLSGLLNILDGVASQEGRVLIMTTNHIEKLDKALIRPGRVDMIVKFDRADSDMTAAIFRAIYAPLEGDEPPSPTIADLPVRAGSKAAAEAAKRLEDEAVADKKKKADETARVDKMSLEFAAKIPAHEFSPAEIQGWLLKNKRTPEKAIEGAEQWVADTRRERKEKELKEAEEKRKKDEEEAKKKKEEEEEKAKKKKEDEDEEKKKKKKEKSKKKKQKAKKAAKRKSKDDDDKNDESASDSDASSDSESESDESSSGSEDEAVAKKSKKKRSKTKDSDVAAAAAPVVPPSLAKEDTIKAEKADDDGAVLADQLVTAATAVAISVDTDKAKFDSSPDGQVKTPASADSGYGTP